jgi:hypothetical protein
LLATGKYSAPACSQSLQSLPNQDRLRLSESLDDERLFPPRNVLLDAEEEPSHSALPTACTVQSRNWTFQKREISFPDLNEKISGIPWRFPDVFWPGLGMMTESGNRESRFGGPRGMGVWRFPKSQFGRDRENNPPTPSPGIRGFRELPGEYCPLLRSRIH